MKIGAIVLTKDEEPRIEWCLRNIRPYLDWIVVLDGGSTDKTLEIATKYANLVVVRVDMKDFDVIRNHARTFIPKDMDYILEVDADERFDPFLLRHLRRIISLSPHLCYRFPRLNPEMTDYPDYQVRLYKNTSDLEWKGSPHEVLCSKGEGKRADQIDCEAIDFPIIHLERRKDISRSWW
jgi:(heptosyl)LPS beta-1,4-glucosyltransferase